MNTEKIQSCLKELGLEAWLLYDFHGSNPVARHVAGLGADRFATRRWFGLVPAAGEPIWLHHAIEAHLFADLPGRRVRFVGYHELRKKLGEILAGMKRVAMEYAPGGANPYVSRVDAGTIEMVRAVGPEVVSSADLVQFIEARWTTEGLASHRRAAQGLKEVLHATFDEVARAVGAGRAIDEYTVQQFMGEQFRARKLFYDPPIVAVNANAGNPHYESRPEGSAPLRKGDLLLTDLWCREEPEGQGE